MHICADEIIQFLMGISMLGGALTILRAKVSKWRASRTNKR